MRSADVRESDLASHACYGLFMLRVPITVHQNDGERAQTSIEKALQVLACFFFVQGQRYFAMCMDALGHFHNLLVEQFRQNDAQIEEARAILVGDRPEERRVGKTGVRTGKSRWP